MSAVAEWMGWVVGTVRIGGIGEGLGIGWIGRIGRTA